MCGRFDLSRNARELLRLLGVEGSPPEWPPRYNVAPSQEILLILADDEQGHPLAAPARWGFRPPHAQDRPGAPTPINARAETVARSRYFADSFAHRRAVAPADGWYEWREEAGGKQPYRVTRRDGAPLLLAAIWTPSSDPPGRRAAILTEPARGVAREIHPRMPVVLADDCWRSWIDPTVTDREAVREAVSPLPAGQLVAYPVSRRVGNPRDDDPTLIKAEGEALIGDSG